MSQLADISEVSLEGVVTSIATDSGTAIPVAGVINILGGTNATTSGSGNTIVIDVTGSGGVGAGYTWQAVTSADNPVTLVAGNAYIAKGGTSINFLLPLTSSIGVAYYIVGQGNLWTLSQNAGQSIQIGDTISTVGITGSITATKISDSLAIITATTDTEFISIELQGNLTII